VTLLVTYWVITVHHFASVFRWKHFLRIIDYILLTIEIVPIGIDLINFNLLTPFTPEINASNLVYELLSCILFIALSISWLARTVLLVYCRGRNLFTPFDLMEDSPELVNDLASSHPAARVWLVIGSSWKTRILGETRLMIISRSVGALVIIVIICFYSILSIIINPINASNLVSTSDAYIPFGLSDASHLDRLVQTWTVVATIGPQAAGIMNNPLQSAINVTLIWPPTLIWPQPSAGPPQCAPNVNIPNYGMESVGIYCPGNLQVSGLLVTVNFTKLNVPLTDLSLSSVYVYIGLTNATFDSPIGKAEPIPLSPGLNLLGHLTYYFHQGPVKRDLTTFGFQSATQTQVVTSIDKLFPDPSPAIPRSENISTLRIFLLEPFLYASGLRLVQEERTKTVVAGFASVGGIWTFLNGVFAVIFGDSLLRILFGIKPLSVFGLVHTFHRKRLREACMAEYPMLAQQNPPKSERGLVSLLQDRLIDLDFLKEEENKSIVQAPMGRDDLEMNRLDEGISTVAHDGQDLAGEEDSALLQENHKTST